MADKISAPAVTATQPPTPAPTVSLSNFTDEEQDLAEIIFKSFGMLSRGSMQKVEGVSQGEMALLGYLIAQGEAMAPSELASKLLLSTARVASTLNALEGKGYVVRVRGQQDKRRIEVSITAEGRYFFQSHHDSAALDVCRMVHDLGMDDSRELARITTRMCHLAAEKEGIELPPFVLTNHSRPTSPQTGQTATRPSEGVNDQRANAAHSGLAEGTTR